MHPSRTSAHPWHKMRQLLHTFRSRSELPRSSSLFTPSSTSGPTRWRHSTRARQAAGKSRGIHLPTRSGASETSHAFSQFPDLEDAQEPNARWQRPPCRQCHPRRPVPQHKQDSQWRARQCVLSHSHSKATFVPSPEATCTRVPGPSPMSHLENSALSYFLQSLSKCAKFTGGCAVLSSALHHNALCSSE